MMWSFCSIIQIEWFPGQMERIVDSLSQARPLEQCSRGRFDRLTPLKDGTKLALDLERTPGFILKPDNKQRPLRATV